MGRNQSPKVQRTFTWKEAMRWEDVPSAIRAEIKAMLSTLLQRADASQEGGDDQ